MAGRVGAVRLGVTTAEVLDGAQRMAAVLRGAVPPDGTVRCWWCGAEPELVEVTRLGDAEPSYIPGYWPPSHDGHQHAEVPPTPGQLEQAGHEALMRIIRESA
jgi:hypothetical protein